MILRAVNGRVVTASGISEGAAIHVEGGRIAAVDRGSGGTGAVLDLEGGWLLPGFVDTQVNGGGGVLFNDRIDVDAIAAIGEAHARSGTTAFLPTLISDTPAMIAEALAAVDAAIDRGVPGVVGIHIEGPFINEARRGIHEAGRIRRLNAETLALLTRPRRGKVMLTLAPEMCDEADIRALTRHEVIVSAGHSNVTYDVAQRAIAAGLSGFTHLFNAMSPLHHREPGAVGAAFDSDTYCGIIADGAHVHPAVLRLAVKAKGPRRLMLVTDGMPSVGTTDTEFMLQGKRILVRDGLCIFEDRTLAGAHLDMAAAVHNMVEMTGVQVADAALMASTTPAEFLSLQSSHGAIASGMRADWVWVGPDLQPRGTWIAGTRVAEPLPPLARAAAG